MFTTAVRILTVGPATTSTQTTLDCLNRSGWTAHAVKSYREAETVLRTIRFSVILAAEKLPDGSGYDLAEIVTRQSGSLFVAVNLTETSLWLTVVEQGKRSLGNRAMNPLLLESEVGSVLRALDAKEEEDNAKLQSRGTSGAVLRSNNPAAKTARKPAAVNGEPRTFGEEANSELRSPQKRSLPPFRKSDATPPAASLAKHPSPLEGYGGSQVNGKWWRGQ